MNSYISFADIYIRNRLRWLRAFPHGTKFKILGKQRPAQLGRTNSNVQYSDPYFQASLFKKVTVRRIQVPRFILHSQIT